ncbi:tryptophan-rich sensory protein [Anderseniella sp. Alg231-50]|uniref:tryptophan-rich sensory protein n=1 Tax=Anderseniella sp. Alg231-50 TaxID=1922226 RepID=UPI000D55FFB8
MTPKNDANGSAANQWLVLAGFIALCLAVAGIAGWATNQSVATWYLTLNRPSWTPPNWLFAPVWTLLYVMMAVAAWQVWRVGGGFSGKARSALIIFFVQLALNFAWSFAFFAARSPALGLLVIVAMWLAIAATIAAFRPIDRLAAWLLVPYLVWVSYATALNFSIWTLN